MSDKKVTALNITLAIYPHVLATSLTLPIEMLRAGEAYARRHNKDTRPLIIKLMSEKDKVITSRSGLSITADECLTEQKISNAVPDILIVPSLWRNPRPVLRNSAQLIAWIYHCWQQGSTIIGVGTGVCFLAESGLLNNHPATTHWHYSEQFQRDYPKVLLKPDFFITQSERIYCAASLNALADIVVHLIDKNYGLTAAQNVEGNFSHEIRKPYEEQRYLEGAVDRHADELIAQIQFWLQTNLNSSLTLHQVAQQFGLSQRSFTRRFKAATGQRAIQYWQTLKITAAKELLASSNLSIQEISYHVGYQDQSHLTRLFKQSMTITPKEYRAMVRKKLFSQ